MGRLTGDLKERTLQFGVEVLRAVAKLPRETGGWIVGKQLGRAATSVGANVWEADAAFSDSDFAHKMSIARKEASETEYWLELSRRADMLPAEVCTPLASEIHQLAKILGTIVRKTQEHVRAEKGAS